MIKNDLTIFLKISRGERPSANDHPGMPAFLWDIITLCWSQKAAERLSIAEVLQRLTSNQRAL